jgi:hypothetical protein
MRVELRAAEDPRRWLRTSAAPLEFEQEPTVLAILSCGEEYFPNTPTALEINVLSLAASFESEGVYRSLPREAGLGASAARWAKARGASRVAVLVSRFEPRSGRIAEALEESAGREGPEDVRLHPVIAPYDALVDRILGKRPDLVVHAGEMIPWDVGAKLYPLLRARSFAGPILVADLSVGDGDARISTGVVDGVHVISPVPPPAPAFARSRGRPVVREELLGYLGATTALEAIDRVGKPDRAAVKAAANPKAKHGVSPPSIWVVRQGRLEFVEQAP